ncbi:MAG TPA: polysaccharide deacetylase family protein [Candidatus Sulfotelmatobacter sp.]|jgi:peptidoglycan/xylan/chitin deacetylase (PgdA/CDA1 family)|nr:polysaccharide deacetylase family protein [Candidatus Sulfotelmatobacter sp.]
MNKKFLVASFVYLFVVIFYLSFVQIHDTSLVYADYVSTPHFVKNTPPEFKQLFFSVAHDGENALSPIINNGVVFNGTRTVKEVALTFDADMTPWMKEQLNSGNVQSYYNQQLIDYLDQTQTKATLFLTGMWIETYHDEAKKLASDPLFELGNHSYSHPSFSGYCYGLDQITPDEKLQEIDKTQQLLFNLTQKQNTLFRFPGGCYSRSDIELLHKKSIEAIQWDVVGNDGFNNDTQSIVNNVLSNVHNGSIIVMHMNGYPNDPKTSDALPEIITNLKKEGYSFVTVSELQSQALSSVREIQSLQNYLLTDNNTVKNGA